MSREEKIQAQDDFTEKEEIKVLVCDLGASTILPGKYFTLLEAIPFP